REHLLLDRHAETPVRGTDSPASEDGRVDVVAEYRSSEVQIAETCADIAAGGRQVLGQRIQEVAVGNEIPVRVGPRSRDRRLSEPAGHACDRFGAGLVG